MTQFNITGMSCAACVARVEKAVNSVDGVNSCSVSLLTNSMGVEGSADVDKIISAVKSGDTIIFDSVSRMSRNAEEGFTLYEELYNKNIELIFIKEPHINTATYKKAIENNITLTGTDVDYILEGVNKYLLALAKEQIKLAFEQAQKEVDDLHQRTKEGIETAR